MSRERQENSEARSMQPAAIETMSLLPNQQDMAAFWESLKLAGSTSLREQEMFSSGFTFASLESLYGGSGATDNKAAQKGIIGTVDHIGVVPMAETKLEGDRQAATQPGNGTLSNPEVEQVRTASAKQVEAIKAANPNQSDGSLQSWASKTPAEKLAYAEKTGQDGSLELIERKPSGQEVVIAARQMFAEVETKSQAATKPQELADVGSRPIIDYGYDVTQLGDRKVIKTGVEYQVGKPPEVTEQSLFGKIGSLPLDQQAQVIGAGIKAFSGEMSHQQFRIGVGAITGLGEGVVGLAQGAESLGNAIIGVAQFSRDVMSGSPAAAETASKACDSVSKLLTGGVRVYSAAEGYLESVGAATNVGDYGKALRDVAWLGGQINSRWEAMTPEEKTRLTTKLAVENLGGLAVGFGTDKLAKSIKITEALEALGAEASAMAPGVRDKVGKLISRMSDELMPQPMGITPDGRLMPIPRDANVLMSKADDLAGGASRLMPGKDGALIKFENLKNLEVSNVVKDANDKHWTGANFLTGWKVESTLKANFMAVGEALPNSFPAIDGWSVEKGLVTSIKSVELRAPTYQDMEKFEERIGGYLKELEAYDGTRGPILGHWIKSERINEKVLHLGIPDGSMTIEQKNVLEKLAKDLERSGSDTRIRLTALK